MFGLPPQPLRAMLLTSVSVVAVMKATEGMAIVAAEPEPVTT